MITRDSDSSPARITFDDSDSDGVRPLHNAYYHWQYCARIEELIQILPLKMG